MGTRKIGLSDIENTTSPKRSRLLAPVRYLRIDAPEKTVYDYWIPGVTAVVCWLIYNLLNPKPSMFGAEGILTSVQSLLIMAVPFLIGALASVAMGSPGEHLDRRAVGVGIRLDGKALSLRQFVCHLLGYLSFLGLVTFIAITVAIFVRPTLVLMLQDSPILSDGLSQVFNLAMFSLISAFVVTTFWALYFLTDVVNHHD